MKKLLYILLVVSGLSACKKSELNLVNPNEPTPSSSLVVESGLLSFSKGIFSKGLSSTYVISRQLHSYMGDELYSPYGNWGWRWAEQVTSITLPNGTVLRNPIGPEQKPQLQSTNSRTAGDLNVFQYEWQSMNLLNVTCNQILVSIESPDMKFSGDVANKKNMLRAWAYWWKGYAYSHIGSMYLSGIINNKEPDGTTNGDFKVNTEIIAEANSNFDKCLASLNAITNVDTYNATLDAVIPSFCDRGNRVSIDMWKRQISSYKARNIMANKKVSAMTSADWAAVTALAQAGVQAGDHNFRIGMDPAATNDLAGGFYHPYALLGSGNQFCFVSERLIQEYSSSDARLTKNFYRLGSPNLRADRGFNFGTRWGATAIEDGGLFSTSNNQGFMELGCTYEENQLDIAEANIRTGSVEAGLTIIDAMRRYQLAGVTATAGTGLSQAQAVALLMRERRVSLFQRGTAFYDARRWGITASAANGGGRTNAVVYLPASVLGTSSADVRNCTIVYNFMDYFDVPLNELDFNPANPGSAPIKTQ